jgi:hypothetical protein
MALTGGGRDWTPFDDAQPGLHVEVATWLHDHKVAAVAADNAIVEASHTVDGYHIPLHMIALRDLGIHFGEYWYLEERLTAPATACTSSCWWRRPCPWWAEPARR